MDRHAPRILIAGLGNMFLGDNGFGVEVTSRLLGDPPDGDVYIVDFGLRGSHLVFALLDDYDLVILVDAVRRGGRPGTVYLVEPQIPNHHGDRLPDPLFEPQNMDPAAVLRLVGTIGGRVGRLLLVGCEPTPPGEANFAETLSGPVRRAVDRAVYLVRQLVAEASRGTAAPCRPAGPYFASLAADSAASS